MNTLQPHKLAGLFPDMTPEEFAGLLADVREHGVREPILIFEGLILDGRHRYRAAQEAGVACVTITFEGDAQAALALVVSMNLRRRHLSTSQRAMVAAKIATMTVGGDRRSDHSANLQNDLSVEQAAAKLDVSPRSVATARKLQQDAPALAAKVAAGEMNLNAASDRHKASVKPKQAPPPPAQAPTPQASADPFDDSPEMVEALRVINAMLPSMLGKVSEGTMQRLGELVHHAIVPTLRHAARKYERREFRKHSLADELAALEAEKLEATKARKDAVLTGSGVRGLVTYAEWQAARLHAHTGRPQDEERMRKVYDFIAKLEPYFEADKRQKERAQRAKGK